MGIRIKNLAKIKNYSIELLCKWKLIELPDGSKFIRLRRSETVSYTHLTLPTSDLV